MSDLKQELASLRLEHDAPSRRRWPVVVVLLAALVLGAGIYLWRADPRLNAIEVETVLASVATPQQTSAGSPILTASGYVVARRKAVVSAKIQGRLSWLKVEEGSRVREGEMIARLESADFEASVQVARSNLQHAEADLQENQRQARIARRLSEQNVGSRDAMDAAQSRVNLAEAVVAQDRANLQFAQAQLQNTYILAPFSGIVVKKMAEVGESVAPIPPGVNISTSSGAIVALADLDTLEVEADVAESNVARLGTHQPAEVVVEAFPDRAYKAVLRQVIPTADRTKATVQVKVTILDKDKNLKPEMSAKVTFLEAAKTPSRSRGKEAVPAASTISIPADAITTRDGKSVVFEVRDGKALQREIKPGAEWRGKALVTEGLAGSETLIAHPPEKLKDGDSVRVKS